MRGQQRRAALELVLAVVAAAGSVWSWLASQTTVPVAPILDGEPATTSIAYSPPMLVLMLMLATIAGILAVDGIARLRRARVRSTREIGGTSRLRGTFPVVESAD